MSEPIPGEEAPPAMPDLQERRAERKHRQRITRTVAVLVVLALIAGLALVEWRSRGTQQIGGFTVQNYRAVAKADGRPAPDFTLPRLIGPGNITLSGYRGKVVVLNLWASWCTPCRLEAPGLEATAKAYASKGVSFIGGDERDNRPAALAFTHAFGITYPSAFDPAGDLGFKYSIIGLPSTYIIDPSGRIVYQFIGYTTSAVLRPALDDVLSGKA